MRKFKEESRFVYKGYTCYVLFLDGGYRCGYVEIPNNHRLYNKGYGEININCHGGLTFGEFVNHVYTIGFDCAHCYDGHDFKQAYEYGLIDECEIQRFEDLYSYSQGRHIITQKEVEEELKNIVDQIIENYS